MFFNYGERTNLIATNVANVKILLAIAGLRANEFVTMVVQNRGQCYKEIYS